MGYVFDSKVIDLTNLEVQYYVSLCAKLTNASVVA